MIPGNYPDGTWYGDPTAPWNQPEGGFCSSDCISYKPCPCGSWIYCVANDEWFEPREDGDEYECFEPREGL